MALKIGGKKFSGKHTTYIDAAEDLVRFLVKNENVKKISLGIIRSSRTGTSARNIKIKETASGLEVMVRGSSYVQTIWVYLEKNDEACKKEINDELSKIFFKK